MAWSSSAVGILGAKPQIIIFVCRSLCPLYSRHTYSGITYIASENPSFDAVRISWKYQPKGSRGSLIHSPAILSSSSFFFISSYPWIETTIRLSSLIPLLQLLRMMIPPLRVRHETQSSSPFSLFFSPVNQVRLQQKLTKVTHPKNRRIQDKNTKNLFHPQTKPG